jgi:hypothetical protein
VIGIVGALQEVWNLTGSELLRNTTKLYLAVAAGKTMSSSVQTQDLQDVHIRAVWNYLSHDSGPNP